MELFGGRKWRERDGGWDFRDFYVRDGYKTGDKINKMGELNLLQ